MSGVEGDDEHTAIACPVADCGQRQARLAYALGELAQPVGDRLDDVASDSAPARREG
jgi:hypothetical protein